MDESNERRGEILGERFHLDGRFAGVRTAALKPRCHPLHVDQVACHLDWRSLRRVLHAVNPTVGPLSKLARC